MTALGLAAAMLGLCLAAIIAHDAERSRLWIVLGAAAAVVGFGAVAFAVLVTPALTVG